MSFFPTDIGCDRKRSDRRGVTVTGFLVGSDNTTWAPSFANRVQSASPMPLAPPVTRRPCR